MTEPVSWEAIQFVLQRLRSATLANGFFTDLGTYAQYDDRTQVDDTAPYVLCVARTFDPIERGNGRGSAAEEMEMLIEFAVPREPSTHPERMVHRARADIRRALAKVGRGEAPRGVGAITVGESSLGDAPDGAQLLIAQVSARAGLTELFTPAI